MFWIRTIIYCAFPFALYDMFFETHKIGVVIHLIGDSSLENVTHFTIQIL